MNMFNKMKGIIAVAMTLCLSVAATASPVANTTESVAQLQPVGVFASMNNFVLGALDAAAESAAAVSTAEAVFSNVWINQPIV